jgi:DNA-binding XRE family transcriptional regulator
MKSFHFKTIALAKKFLNEMPLIMKVRFLAGMNQTNFAHDLGVSQSRLSRLELGELKLERDIILPMCRVFKIHPVQIFAAMAKGE